MADHIVGLDFGSRSIKMVVIDNSGEPVVVDYDSESLALDPDPYLRTPDGTSESGGDAEQSGEDDDATDSSAEASGDSREGDSPDAPADREGDDWEADFGPSHSWIETLDRLLSRHDFEQGTQFVTFLPEGRAISIHEQVPFPEPSKVKSILPNLLEDRLPLDPEHVVYDFELIVDEDEGEDAQHTAVVGLGRKRDIRRFLDHLEDSGVNPAVLGVPELMLRYLSDAALPRSETDAIVDIGHQFTRVIVLEDGEAVLAHSVEVGGWTVTRRIAQKFDISLEQAESYKRNRATVAPADRLQDREEEALSEAVRAALRPLVRDLRRNFQSLYANQRIQLDAIYLCGGSSQIDHLEEYLDEQFGVPVDPLPLESAVNYQLLEGEGAPESALALACALQPVEDRKEERLLNLRKGEFAYSGDSGLIRSVFSRWGAAAAVLLVLFFGTLFAEKYRLEAKADAMDQAVAEQTKELFGKPVTDSTVINNLASGQSGGQRAFVPEMSAYQLYFELMSRVSEDIELELDRVDVDIDRNIVQMSGTTTDPQTVDTIVTDLEQLECLSDINKKPVRVQNENEARFELEISSKCS
jgi:type IV pilus assembly protein PilM